MNNGYFLNMIKTLREKQEVVLYQNLFEISEEEKNEVADYLYQQYSSEQLEYPYTPPSFDKKAATWAAEVVYLIAQLILYRQNKPEELENLFPNDNFECSASTISSADLCLRFLPYMYNELKMIDPEDDLLNIIEAKLHKWHYSGINYPLNTNDLDHTIIFNDKCLLQLYINRVIEYKNKELAKLPLINKQIRANLGIYTNEFWSEINTIKSNECD